VVSQSASPDAKAIIPLTLPADASAGLHAGCTDPDLRRVLKAWPMLPASLRAVLGAMAENGQLAAMLIQAAGGKPTR
jgi:hypothetical protein